MVAHADTLMSCGGCSVAAMESVGTVYLIPARVYYSSSVSGGGGGANDSSLRVEHFPTAFTEHFPVVHAAVRRGLAIHRRPRRAAAARAVHCAHLTTVADRTWLPLAARSVALPPLPPPAAATTATTAATASTAALFLCGRDGHLLPRFPQGGIRGCRVPQGVAPTRRAVGPFDCRRPAAFFRRAT